MNKMIISVDEDGLRSLADNEIDRLSDALNTCNRGMKNQAICHAIGVLDSIKRLVVVEENISNNNKY
jgi:hypothetical protein